MFSELTRKTKRYAEIMKTRPANAKAQVRGGDAFPQIHGSVDFYAVEDGTLVVAEIWGLPQRKDVCENPFFAFHIHEGKACGKPDLFADTMGHYNPHGCNHPGHAGDMPPLLGNSGYAFMAFYTTRFSVQEIIGRTVVIHEKYDDFTTPPSGNAGAKIACGVIIKK